jgi:pseudouridine-5'-monophosphatase
MPLEAPHLSEPIAYVIYDLDGLLLDTESLHNQVNQAIAQRYGKTFDPFIKAKIAGRSPLESAAIVIDLLDLPLTPEAYVEQRQGLIRPLYATAKPLAGAMDLTHHLHRCGIPQAIATSSPRPNVERKTARHQAWFELFACMVTGDDPALQRSKPAPDIFLLAAERLGAEPKQCLVFEDSLAGMEAALAAGMSVVVIPDPHLDRQLYQDAHQILASLSDFDPPFWHLPSWQAS